MRYGRFPLKIIQFDDPNKVRGQNIGGKFSCTKFLYDISNNVLPYQINWKYRLYDGDKHIFSYIAESKIAVINDGKEATEKDIEMMILNMKLPFDMAWEDKTRGTKLFGSMPSIDQNNMKILVEELLQLLKGLPLGGELPKAT